MGSSTADILFRFLGDSRSLDTATGRASRSMSTATRASRTLTKAMGALGVAFGAREIIRFGADSIEAASDYTESVNAIMVVNKEGAASIDAFGRNAAEGIGLSRTAVN